MRLTVLEFMSLRRGIHALRPMLIAMLLQIRQLVLRKRLLVLLMDLLLGYLLAKLLLQEPRVNRIGHR